MEFFLNPWFMAAGGALVSLPILIHLINRMRFKRVRWAAMEFLLKSQKRNRRRLIIEQLILLALRCLLVMLFAFLVAEFVGLSASIFSQTETVHVVILDNTLSMSDRSKDRKGREHTAFDNAKELIKSKVAASVVQASSTQRFKVYLLSDLDQPIFDERLNTQTLETLKNTLDRDERCREATDLHISPVAAIRRAKEVLLAAEYGNYKKVFHFVSDFRDGDWRGADEARLQTELTGLAEGADSNKGATVYLVDAADPERPDSQDAPKNNPNVAISELRPPVRVTAGGESLEFTVTVQNFTNQRYDNVFLNYSVNGTPALGSPKVLNAVTPGESHHKFVLALNDPGFNLVTASLADPEDFARTGIDRDNTRHTVIEVRPSVKILVIDGDHLNFDPAKRDADLAPRKTGTWLLNAAISRISGYGLECGTLDDLKKASLFQYPAVYLLNIAEIKDDKARTNLEKYVHDGGNVCFFLGDKVRPGEYNRTLWKNNTGIFPAPLAAAPTEEKVDPEEMLTRVAAQEPNLLIPNPAHPLFQQIKQEDPDDNIRYLLAFNLNFDKYYGVDRAQWNRPGDVEDLFALPNRRSVEAYGQRAKDLVNSLPVNDSRFKEFEPTLRFHRERLLRGIGGGYKHLYELSLDLYSLLHEPGRKFDPANPKVEALPGLAEFWQENGSLHAQFEAFYNEVRFGDPLVLSKAVGHGRVVACMTTANNDWTNWSENASYVIYMPELRRFLFTLHDSPSLPVGATATVDLDATLYEGRMKVFQQPLEPLKKEDPRAGDDDDTLDRRAGLSEVLSKEERATNDRYHFEFEGRKTGLYLLKFYPQTPAGEKVQPLKRPVVFNIDPTIEGKLERTKTEVLEKGPLGHGGPTGIKVMTVDSDFSPLSNRQANLSESPWLYLVILLVLVIEQALAVHLSFHTRGSEAHLAPGQTQTSTPRPAPAREAVGA